MAGYSARQESYTTGDTVEAADTNNEFDTVLAAFNATTGHAHDGTAGEGPPLVILQDADGDTKIQIEKTSDDDTIRFDAAGNTDVIKVNTSSFVVNDDGDVFNVRIEGDTNGNLFYTDGTNDRVGFGTASPSSFLHAIESSTGTLVTLESTDATATAGPDLVLWRNSASPADSDVIGSVKFDGEDSGGTQTTYASIVTTINDVTDTTEDGTLDIKAMVGGTLTTGITLAGANTTVAGTLTSTGALTASAAATVGTTLGVTGLTTATGGVTSGGNIISDTDSTDDLGTTSVRWANLYVDDITTTTAITAGGVVTGLTVEATGDTSAADNAAMGYTATEGLILTGQGSTNDITIKNDADADVLVVPTGTTNVDIVGVVTGATFEPDGATSAADNAAIGYDSTNGITVTGQGSTNDVVLKNDADAIALEVPTGTQNVNALGNLTVTGDLTVNGSTSTVDSTNTTIKDPLIELNTGAASNSNDLGLVMERGSTGDNAWFGWDESADQFVVGTTTATGSSTGNISFTAADLAVGQITATSGVLNGLTSLSMSAGATLTAGFLDEDTMTSDSAVAGVTQQSVKAYVDANTNAPGLPFTWDVSTDAADQGAGKVWLNHATPMSATLLYVDDQLSDASTDVSTFIASLDDPTTPNSAFITLMEGGISGASFTCKVSGAVTDLTTHQSLAITPIAMVGSFSADDPIGMMVGLSGDDGAISNVVEDITPQLGGNLDGQTYTITTTGDITGGGIHVTGDTAASDAAALGYTATEGLILTGQGSTNDVTIKNDADAEVMGVLTGTTTADFKGVVTATTFEPDGDTSAGDNAAIGYTATEGLILTGQGSTYDVVIKNDADALVLSVATGTDGVQLAGAGYANVTALTSTSNSIAIELGDGDHFTHTFTENTTLANPTSTNTVGQTGTILLTQHASSPKTLAFGSEWQFPGGTAPTVTATNSAEDRIDFVVRSTTKIDAVWTGALS